MSRRKSQSSLTTSPASLPDYTYFMALVYLGDGQMSNQRWYQFGQKKSIVPERTGEPVEAYTLQNTLVVNHPRDNKAERRGE